MSRRYMIRPLSVLASTAVGVALASDIVAGHVRYVTTREEACDWLAFLASALTEPLHLLALGAGGVAVVVGIVGYLHVRAFDCAVTGPGLTRNVAGD